MQGALIQYLVGELRSHIVFSEHTPTKKSHPPFPFFQPQLWASLVVQTINNLPAIQETRIRSLGQGRSVGEGNDYPLQYSCLEKSMDRGTWWGTVHGVAKSLT